MGEICTSDDTGNLSRNKLIEKQFANNYNNATYDCNKIWTENHVVRKRTLNQARLALMTALRCENLSVWCINCVFLSYTVKFMQSEIMQFEESSKSNKSLGPFKKSRNFCKETPTNRKIMKSNKFFSPSTFFLHIIRIFTKKK